MKVIIQRVKNASVRVDKKIVGQIETGLVVLLGVTHDDSKMDVDYLVSKIINLRIFEDENEKMNVSLIDSGGSILSISQFTLYADTRKGRRPNFMNAAASNFAKDMYDTFNHELKAKNVHIETGVFGEMMDVELTNSGPVTIIIDSKE